MPNASNNLPLYKTLVLENDLPAVACMDLDQASREKVFQMCSLLASARDPGWVTLVASWGFDLNCPSMSSVYSTSRNWLWNALNQGKLAQAIALVAAGWTVMEVDDRGRSGLGALVEEVNYDNLAGVLDMLAQFHEMGLGWQSWPDALDFDARMSKNMGASLAVMLASRAAKLLNQNTVPIDASCAPVRL